MRLDTPITGTTVTTPREIALTRRFLTRLTRVPLGAWHAVSSNVEIDPSLRALEPGELRAARAHLRSVMETMPHAVQMTRAKVADVASVAAEFTGEAAAAAMKRVALTAALALAARPMLSAADFARLYEPFAALIPADELDGGAVEATPGG